MRFMGLSKDNRLVRFAVLALVGALVASVGVVIWPADAQAARKFVWSAKFKCSQDNTNSFDPVIDLPFIGGNAEFVVNTVIDVHNFSNKTVETKRKFVIARRLRDGGSGVISIGGLVTDALGPDDALGIDCEDIHGLFNATTYKENANLTNNIVEGFVVIESKKDSLDVCANYDKYLFFEEYAGCPPENNCIGIPKGLSAAGGVSVDVECVKAKRVKGKFRNDR